MESEVGNPFKSEVAINWIWPHNSMTLETDDLQQGIQKVTCDGLEGRKSLFSIMHQPGSQTRHFNVCFLTECNLPAFPKAKWGTLANSLSGQLITNYTPLET